MLLENLGSYFQILCTKISIDTTLFDIDLSGVLGGSVSSVKDNKSKNKQMILHQVKKKSLHNESNH